MRTARMVFPTALLGGRIRAEHPELGRTVTYPGAPFKLSATPWQIRSPAPRLGEHNGQIYGERLGLSLEQIEQLHQQGVI